MLKEKTIICHGVWHEFQENLDVFLLRKRSKMEDCKSFSGDFLKECRGDHQQGMDEDWFADNFFSDFACVLNWMMFEAVNIFINMHF